MRICLSLLFLVLFTCNAWAAELKGSCQVAFKGTSTLHDFSGTAACQPFAISLVDGAIPSGPLLEQVDVAVAGMETSNESRDKKMRAMFDAEHFPLISGWTDASGNQLVDTLTAAQNGQAQLALHLKIRDLDLPQTAKISNIHEDEKALDLELEMELSLKAYHLKPPSVLGLIRVGDLVKVKIHLLIEKIGQVPKHILS